MRASRICGLSALVAALLALGHGSLGCGPPGLPPGPAPEYERPKVEPWDAAPPSDPFDIDDAKVDWVDDELPEAAPDSADAGPNDAAAEADVSEDPKAADDAPNAPREGGAGAPKAQGDADEPRDADSGSDAGANEGPKASPKSPAPESPK